MARIGIQYSDVSRVAAKLIAEGKIPTVDGVRAALGGTGSKSTIAPFLKRWKAEQEDTAIAEVSLPAPLLNAVRGLHEHMEAEFQQRRDALERTHAEALQMVERTAVQLQTEKEQALAANAALEDELARTRKALADLQAHFQAQHVTIASMQAEQIGLQQRLSDRATEIATLGYQLTQAREQFAHYQEASAAQRATERREYEQRIGGLEFELRTATKEVAGLQAALAQKETSITALTADNATLHKQVDTFTKDLQQAQFDKARLAEQLEEARTTLSVERGLTKQWEHAAQNSRIDAASYEREAEIRNKQLTEANAQIEGLLQEKMGWIQDRAVLEQRLQTAEKAEQKQ